MNPEQIQNIAELGTLVSFTVGQDIYQEDFLVNDPAAFFVLEGQVEVVKKYTPLQKEVFEIGKGDIFGTLEIYTGTPRLTTATAKTDVQAVAFGKDDLEKAMSNNLNFALTSIRQLSKTLRQINARIKKLA